MTADKQKNKRVSIPLTAVYSAAFAECVKGIRETDDAQGGEHCGAGGDTR